MLAFSAHNNIVFENFVNIIQNDVNIDSYRRQKTNYLQNITYLVFVTFMMITQ